MSNKSLFMVIEKSTMRVLEVALATNCFGVRPGYIVITGEPAHWLYIALTGHSISQHPHLTNAYMARSARALIVKIGDSNHDEPGGYTIARQVVTQWGQHVQPWFGMIAIDKNGNHSFSRQDDLISLVTERIISGIRHEP